MHSLRLPHSRWQATACVHLQHERQREREEQLTSQPLRLCLCLPLRSEAISLPLSSRIHTHKNTRLETQEPSRSKMLLLRDTTCGRENGRGCESLFSLRFEETTSRAAAAVPLPPRRSFTE